ncbi:MAG: hypothetical protein KBT03_04700 [Bacteroidales bacterium]|nr:hypothetical protein [Candidatus Scybalousia scybalohippi]
MALVEGMSPADLAAVTGNNDGFGGNGAWWIILLFLVLGWGRNGYGMDNGGGSSVKDAYTLSSDFATIQRQLSDGFGALESKGDTINNGLCSGFYETARIADGINTNILTSSNAIQTANMQGFNALQTQISQCCCDTKAGMADIKYAEALSAKDTQQAVASGFCQTNFNNQNNTRDIIDANNANTRAILDAINANKVEALKDRIAEQNQMITSLNLAASQSRQNEYLIDKLGYHCPVSAYVVQPPQTISFPNTCGVANYNGGCGCNTCA